MHFDFTSLFLYSFATLPILNVNFHFNVVEMVMFLLLQKQD